MQNRLATLAFGLAACVAATEASAQATLNNVKQKGYLSCGTGTGLAGFGVPDAQGKWSGFDVDYCRAIAAAVFDDANKVRFVPLSTKDRFTALQAGEVDVLVRNSTWTMSRDTNLGLDFVGINYYDGQGFMATKKLGITSAKQLDGASICAQQGTTTELNLADYFRTYKLKYEVVSFNSADDLVQAYENGRCDAITNDASAIYADRVKFTHPDEHVILPERISKEPLGPAVRHGDNQWADLVRWTHYAMLSAEELGVSKANIDTMKSSDNPDVRRLLGVEGNYGAPIGLTVDWAYRIIRRVGNYGEVFETNFGPLKIDRGLNALWNKGGLQYAPPIR